MRSGACTVQQTLTAEAASILKHSLSLARRRGHAQVTPLHVAATLLSTRASLLRRACLKSQQPQLSSSHPLQCRALELCFNVALNRLPTTPGPILHGQPSLSNALVAALKRAQAHQRRGCIEQQQSQQPILTIKVELEQLIISILDDPSVSRVMREAGFSSTVVKANIEDSSSSPSSVFQCYNTTSGSGGVFSSPCSPSQTHFLSYEQNPFFFSPSKKLLTSYIPDSASLKQDIKLVFEVLLRKNKRRNSVIVGDCVSTTESLVSELTSRVEKGDVPDEMKHVRFLKFYFSPMSLKFMKREDVEKHVCDLKRTVDSIVAEGGAIIYTGDLKWTVVEEGEINGYNAADHLVTELGRLISDYYMSNKVWLVATASYQTYLRCQMRQPPLEVQWALQAVSVPTGGLSLSLHASSCHDTKMMFSEMEKKQFEHEKLTCCAECSSNYEKDVQSFKSSGGLPPWMHVHGSNNSDSQKGEMVELRRKWNTLCHSLHRGRLNQSQLRSTMYYNNQGYPYGSSFPWWPSQSSGLTDSASISFIDSKPNSVPRFRRQNSCTIELNFGNVSPNLDSLKNTEDKEVKVTLALGSDSPRKSTGLCELLQGNLPWQSEIISSIAEALMGSKKETWLLIEGNDMIGKRRLARVVAEYVLGSPDLLLYMDMKHNNETTRCNERLKRAFSRDEKLVVMVENVDLADTQCLKLLADRFEGGDDGGSSRSIIILTKSISSSFEEHYAKKDNIVIEMKLNINGSDTNKRKHEWGGSNKTKTPRTKPSSHILDLNMKAADDDEEEEANESGEVSDLTADLHVGFLELIQKRYFLNQTEGQHKEMKEDFMAKFKRVVEEIFGGENKVSFSIEERVLEGVLVGSSYFVNSLFEKWLKDIFQTGLQNVKKNGGGGGIDEIRLSYGGILEKAMENGYMGSCLPKNIQV
ncbi:Chaperone ClpB1 -like protein [Gossypium arboreum]|uniref:Chaperone ClpB1-like protein n=1 Tax=Gossypium arboreum TaxID=29729 RepID=A0A0B0P489_GOSAR|nr:Chaperone ClpB1 -like protein [Gossypium arboreum]